MTEPEDGIRRYVAASTRGQRPVDLAEVVARRRTRRAAPRVLAGAAALVCVVLMIGFVVVDPGRRHRTVVEVSPSTVRKPSPSTLLPTGPCAASQLVVTSTQGERLHPDVLPPGFVLRGGNENDLGARGQLTYTPPGGGDLPRVELLRYRTTVALDQLSSGTTHRSLTVQGHVGVFTTGGPAPFSTVAWATGPGTALVVSGYKLAERELLNIANGVRYDAGTELLYPPQIQAKLIAQAAAEAAAGVSVHKGAAVLSSLGEVGALTRATDPIVAQIRINLGLPVTEPVWVVSNGGRGFVIDASSARVLGQLTRVPAGLSDRRVAECAPPFGVLTRSEILALHPATQGVTQTAILTTLSQYASIGVGAGSSACQLSACDPDVPVWVLISAASDHRFTDQERGLGSRPTSTVAGSWQIIAIDARTGPQNTDLASVSLGPGRPPAAYLALTDLAAD